PPEGFVLVGRSPILSWLKAGIESRRIQTSRTAPVYSFLDILILLFPLFPSLRKIKDHDPDFSTKTFPEKAQEIFIEAHNSLANFNKQKLHSLVTERCYPDMVRGNRYRTIRWRFLESLEPPRVVHVRCEGVMNRGNLYGQVTVRMHSRQILAIYDRFGRLMYGGEEIPKDVLEYVVFERYLVNPYGTWRMHGKIVPEWAPPKDPIIKTLMIPAPAPDPSQEHEKVK
ncbi:39S ribosomal protein L45, mitochondrial, partial [Cyanistes caeruleus]